MTTLQRASEEISEAFRPVDTWRYAAPIERGIDLNLAMLDTLTTLAFWDWSVTLTRAQGLWTLQVAKTIGGKSIRARVVDATFLEALWKLGNRLEAVLAGAEVIDDDMEIAA